MLKTGSCSPHQLPRFLSFWSGFALACLSPYLTLWRPFSTLHRPFIRLFIMLRFTLLLFHPSHQLIDANIFLNRYSDYQGRPSHFADPVKMTGSEHIRANRREQWLNLLKLRAMWSDIKCNFYCWMYTIIPNHLQASMIQIWLLSRQACVRHRFWDFLARGCDCDTVCNEPLLFSRASQDITLPIYQAHI